MQEQDRVDDWLAGWMKKKETQERENDGNEFLFEQEFFFLVHGFEYLCNDSEYRKAAFSFFPPTISCTFDLCHCSDVEKLFMLRCSISLSNLIHDAFGKGVFDGC